MNTVDKADGIPQQPFPLEQFFYILGKKKTYCLYLTIKRIDGRLLMQMDDFWHTMDNLISFFSLSILLLLQLVEATNTSSGSLSIKAYWKEVLPSTPMPNAVRAFLPSSAQISAGSGGGHNSEDQVTGAPERGGVGWVRRWGALGHDHDTPAVNWSPDLAPLYFLRKDLLPDSKMNVTLMVPDHASSSGVEPTFLPRQQAQAIPFSSSNLTTILNMFSIEPHSHHASLTTQTLVDCEMPALRGEVKYCATSLESMIDFVVAELGSNEIHVAVTSVVKIRGEEVKARTYRVGVGGGRLLSHKVVACHNMMFPYAVFYCHNFAGTLRAYMVPLVADDGSQVNAIALCHFDTSNWNPGHASFRLLGVKPGTVPICHFIVKDLAWVPN